MHRGNIFLFIGQFGNQIGKDLVEFLTSMKCVDLVQRNCSFLSVDTEQKAAKILFAKSSVIVENCVLDKTGRGANWAMGYTFQREKVCSESLKDIVLKTIKRKIEKFHDYLPGIIMIHSLIGGTGGGLGCCILESVKDEFPEICITSVTTSPFVSGESPMQHYNALFTLAWLQRYSDCVLLFHNDEVMNELRKTKSKSASGKRLETVSLDEINEYICYNILDLFHPLLSEYEEKIPFGKTTYATETTIPGSRKFVMKPSEINSLVTGCPKTTEAVVSKSNNVHGSITGSCVGLIHKKQKTKTLIGIRQRGTDLSRTDKGSVIGKFDEMDLCEKDEASNQPDILHQHLAVDHHMKFISCKQKHTRQFSSEYLPLLTSLMLDQPKCDHDGNKYSVGAMLLSARGQYAKVIAYNEHEILSYLRSRTLFRRGCDKHVSITTSFLPATSYSAPLSLSLYVNTNRVADYIDYVLCKSEMLYENSAYTHWFHKFGVKNDCFEDAFDTLKNVVKEYRAP